MKDEDKNNLQGKDLKTGCIQLKTFTNEELHKIYCKCKKCGEIVTAYTSKALTSDPPKYSYYCPFCDNNDFVYYNELFSDKKSAQLYSDTTRITGDNDTVGVVYCLICEECIPVSRWEWEGDHTAICEKCKKAILKLRKMFDEE